MLFKYIGLNGRKGKCDIERYGNVILVTELDDNESTSITNFAEHLATMVCKQYNIAYKDLIWIEHYTASDYREENYSVVIFDITNDGFERPSWKFIEPCEVDLVLTTGKLKVKRR